MNAFLSAAASGNTAAIQAEYLRCKCALSSRTPSGQTALHLAALHGHVDALRLLLSYNICASTPDNAGQTPLHIAAQGSSLDVLDLLLEHSGSPSTIESCPSRDRSGKTAIFYAYQNPNTAVLDRFLDRASTCGSGCALTPEVVLNSPTTSRGAGMGDYFACKGGKSTLLPTATMSVTAAAKTCCSV
ncbi:ankyrin repeat-containing domain protein [Aspergillus unguis]